MKELTDQEIKDFLESAPLYAWREFKIPDINRSGLWINEIDAFCDICSQQRPFQDFRPRAGGFDLAVPAPKTETFRFSFTCVSCRKAKREYHVEQVVDEETIKIQKYGELPRKKLERNRVLQKFLSDDLDNYEKALVCLSNGYGVAAFAYFRRVVENNILKLLDLVLEDAKSASASENTLEAIAELREESPMSKKIEIANQALPEYLKPDGLNPLGRLYQVLSEGVHSLSEAECLEKAKAISECLAFLVGELASRKEHRSRFKSMVGGLRS